MVTDLILGTAGHIDHGKTSLIRALTGIETDRLPEEKRRGITIELGFAHLELGDFRLGIVDVPGHERFVRNMLAGATGMDLALLVVAADDSIKPQTREHLEILRLLDLEAGVIALTKCDLVEPDWLELVKEEIRELVADTFLRDAPIVPTSAATGAGIDELRTLLTEAASVVSTSSRIQRIGAPFRLPIDRAFTIAGHGTVVTGSIASGQIKLGDELRIEPGGHPVRIRGLQNHDATVEEVHRGQRAAINLAGVHHGDIQRGQELCSTGHLVPSKLLTVQISMVNSATKPLKNRARVRLHVGTAESLCSVRLLDKERLEANESGLAQLYLSEETVTTWSQPFVIRSESPVITIGGGRVLDPNAEKIRRPEPDVLELVADLSSTDEVTRASAALFFAGLREWNPSDLARTAGIDDVDAAYKQLVERGDVQEIRLSPTRTLRVHTQIIRRLSERIAAALLKMHEQNPLRSILERSKLTHGFSYLGDSILVNAVLQKMQATGKIRLTDKGVSLVGEGPKLSQNEQRVLEQIVQIYRGGGLKPPTVEQCRQQVSKNRDSVPQLVALAEANGDLVQIATDFFLHTEVFDNIRATLTEKLHGSEGLTMSEIREVLDTSRKYAVPLCEYLDEIGFTKRNGDLRVLASLNQSSHEESPN